MLDTAQKYPNAKFFMAHAIYNEVEYEKRLITETDGNVWLELTAVPGNFEHVERLVQSVGSEKLLFGTDMPWFDEYQAAGGILSADITENDMRNILYRNVENIFGTNW